MWISKREYERLIADVDRLHKEVDFERIGASRMSASTNTLMAQKAKDDITIDWMRHRVNALEKQNAVLLNKAAGVNVPVPEIVPTRPGTLSVPPQFESMPSFEDVGPDESNRLGIYHDKDGAVIYGVPGGAKPDGAID